MMQTDSQGLLHTIHGQHRIPREGVPAYLFIYLLFKRLLRASFRDDPTRFAVATIALSPLRLRSSRISSRGIFAPTNINTQFLLVLQSLCVCVSLCVVCVCMCTHTCMMYDTDQCCTHLNLLWGV